MQTHKTLSKLNFRELFVFLIVFVFVNVCISYTGNVSAQVTRPTPNRDAPEIISRDTDTVVENRVDDEAETVNELSDRDDENEIKLPRRTTSTSTEDSASTAEKQKKMMVYLDLLTKTEQRADTLRKQLYDLIDKQNELQLKAKQLEFMLRPESIQSSTNLTGSLRPEDLREQRKVSLKLEKENNDILLQQLESRRTTLELNVQKAESLVEKIRARFDKIVDDALAEDIDLF